jgi:outer membrane protein assembly factor BamB
MPVATENMVYITSGFRGNALQAIRLSDANGDISNSDAIAWEYNRDTPYVPSPLLYQGKLYFLKRNDGILTCLDAATGKVIYNRQRLDGIRGVYASPVAAGNRIYITSLNGTTLVIDDGPEFRVLSQNILDDSFAASPAVVDNELYLRGSNALYCIVAG